MPPSESYARDETPPEEVHMPPLICPTPDHRPTQPGQDCPLYAQRALTQAEQLRRAVLAERNKPRTMAALVWEDCNRQQRRVAGVTPNPNWPISPVPSPPPTRPALPPAEVQPLPVFDLQKGVTR